MNLIKKHYPLLTASVCLLIFIRISTIIPDGPQQLYLLSIWGIATLYFITLWNK